ncbi:MAG TPA: hypothetical protein P5279_04885 [Anaerohalosphaeraceae bacterium]|jgi:hypothetical protein|nr:hypothetical protein [Anaerohalosphaeraceae bacterium]HRT49806.1 hypothetical protein [Anaerohalosphaeraceae bacterium]HRT85534.1 hypothetical protein [Anaerohalosphaeraceae bacterium]
MKSRTILAALLSAVLCTLGASQEETSTQDILDEMARQDEARIAGLPKDVQSLAGVKGVYVLLEYPTADANALDLADAPLQKDIEVKLRLAGVDVITAEENLLSEDGACLRVNISTVGGGKLIAYNVLVRFEQDVYLARSPNRFYVGAPTWRRETFGAGSLAEVAEAIQIALQNGIEDFLTDYITANARR